MNLEKWSLIAQITGRVAVVAGGIGNAREASAFKALR